MTLRAYANKRDTSEPSIVKALEAAGASVYRLDKPVDLLIYFRGRHHLIECKTGKGKLTEAQKKFKAVWPGPVFVIRTPEAAIDFLNGESEK